MVTLAGRTGAGRFTCPILEGAEYPSWKMV